MDIQEFVFLKLLIYSVVTSVGYDSGLGVLGVLKTQTG